MKSIKYLLVLPLCLILFIGSVNAKETKNEDLAVFLDGIGMFSGTNEGYALDESANRLQGVVMVVRLLGKEEEALELNLDHPFEDVPDWASAYVGYLYQEGITTGVNETTFGSEDLLSAQQYLTFLLRVCGYDDSIGDFYWFRSLEEFKERGLISDIAYELYSENEVFLRDDLVFFTYKGLMGPMKDEKVTLLKYLITEEVVEERAMYDYKVAGLEGDSESKEPENRDELIYIIKKAIYNFEETLTIDMSELRLDDISEVMDEVMDEVVEIPGLYASLDSWSASYNYRELNIDLDYKIAYSDHLQSLVVGEEVVKEIVSEDMNDFEKELAIHDYIVENTSYDDRDEIALTSYTMDGVFNDGVAVCQGYANAFFYMTNLAGIDGRLMTGEADSTPHAWNIVEIDGKTYQIDVTYDDPSSKNGSNYLRYSYFNITDEQMALNHTWEEDEYEACVDDAYNYFVYYDLVVYSETELTNKMQGSVRRKDSVFTSFAKDFNVTIEMIRDILDKLDNIESAAFYVNDETGEINIQFYY